MVLQYDYSTATILAFFLAIAVMATPVAADDGDAEDDTLVSLSASATIRSDHEGNGVARLLFHLGRTRWVLLGFGELVLREDAAAPAGYLQQHVSMRSPFHDARIIAGVDAGPLTLGPIAGKGVFHRFRDPTAGGLTWSALTEADRFSLATGLDEPRTQGVFISADPSTMRGYPLWMPRIAWWYTVQQERLETSGFLVHLPVPGLPDAGTIGLIAGTASVDPQRLPDFEAEPWLFVVPPVRSQTLHRQALFWQLQRRSLRLLVEGWRQSAPYRPVSHAGIAAAVLGPPQARVTVRLSGSDAGFLTHEQRRPANPFQGAAMLSHRSRGPRLLREGQVSWTRTTQWETEVRGRLQYRGEVAPGVAVKLNYREALAGEGRLFLSSGQVPGGQIGVTVSGDAEALQRLGVDLGGQFPLSNRYRRSVAVDLAGRWSLSGDDLWHLRGSVAVPLGRAGRVELRCRYDPEDRQQWSGTGTMQWSW